MSSRSYHERDDRRYGSHSKSRSKSRRHYDDDYDDDYRRRRSYSRSRSRSHSRSLERHKRRQHGGSSRSRSRDYDSRRHRSSKLHSRSSSRSRSRSRAHSPKRRSYSRSRSSQRSNKHSSRNNSGSRSPKVYTKHNERHSSRSISKDRNDKNRHLSTESDSRRSKTAEVSTSGGIEQENSSTQYFSSNTNPDNLENLPLPEQTEDSSNANYAEYFAEPDEPIDKERIHREMEEKLRAALAKEGKVYPPPKPEASHPVFANDGSFLEIFKKMQEAQNAAAAVVVSTPSATIALPVAPTTSVAAVPSTSHITKPNVPAPPLVGRRRGGKILKTGLVAKPKVTSGGTEDKDFWSLYLAEVNKYKNHACESDGGNRPLLK